MRISHAYILNRYSLSLCLLFLASTNMSAQSWRSGWVYIENVETGLVIDVQGNVKANGTNVWSYSLNYSTAQMFRFSEHSIPARYGEDARYIRAYDDSSLGSEFYVSVKTPAMVIGDADTHEPGDPRTTRPDLVLAPTVGVLGTDRPRSKKETLLNFFFSIEAKRELDESPVSAINDHSLSSGEAPRQIWKILPVPNEPGVYYIQNAHFGDKMVVEPLGFSSGGTLVLSSFVGTDIQKWRILRTAPPQPISLQLSKFEWYEKLNQKPLYKPWKWHRVQRIRGTLSWMNPNASSITKQNISIVGSSSSETIIPEPSIDRYEFNVRSSRAEKTQEHCFLVSVRGKWDASNWVRSSNLCERPYFEGAPSSVPIPPTGIGKLIVYNCHNNKKTVRLWTYDMTANTGSWKDHGTLVSEWKNGQCLNTSPKTITIDDSHRYLLKAIDCGSSPPNLTQGTCHKLTSPIIQGEKNGEELPFQIS